MQWIKVSLRHIAYFLTSKRGIIFMLGGVIFHGFFTYIVFGVLGSSSDIHSDPLTPSKIEQIRHHAQKHHQSLLLVWYIIVAFEGAYLYNKGLFQRFLLNGFSRWEWGHSLLFRAAFLAMALSVFQVCFANGLGYWLNGIQVIAWGSMFPLAIKLLLYGVFVLLLVSILPSYLTLLLVMAWSWIEGVLNSGLFDGKLLNIPYYLPFNILNEWLGNPEIADANSIFLAGYFLIFTVLFYTTINKKCYG